MLFKICFQKNFFADIKNCVWRDFHDREMFKTQSEKSKIHKSMFRVYDLFNNKDIWLEKYAKMQGSIMNTG